MRHAVNDDGAPAVAELLGEVWRCRIVETQGFALADWLGFRDGRLWFVGECKCRSHTPDAYKTFMVDAAKWVAIRLVAHALGVHPLIVVRFSDGSIYYANLAAVLPTGAAMGGRTDRNDPNDVEPVVYLPIAEFKRVKI